MKNVDVKGLKGRDPRLPCLNPKGCSPITPDHYYCAKATGNCKRDCLICCSYLQLKGYAAQGPCNTECGLIAAGCGEKCPPTNFYGDSCCL
jgi:hypothetical protein